MLRSLPISTSQRAYARNRREAGNSTYYYFIETRPLTSRAVQGYLLHVVSSGGLFQGNPGAYYITRSIVSYDTEDRGRLS